MDWVSLVLDLPDSKRQLSWLESSQVKLYEASTLGHRLLKRKNLDFHLGEDTVVVDIPDDNTPK